MARLAFDLSALRVLLVEDDTFAREFEVMALRQLGVEHVAMAEDGALALDVLRRGTACDLIVSDWNMPNFDGLQLLDAVRKDWPGIAFLMVTNTETLSRISTAKEAGVDGYLIKPFSLEKLREGIHLSLINKLTGDRSITAPRVNPEFDEIETAIRQALADPAEEIETNGDAGSLEDTHGLARKLSNQLNAYVQSLDSTGPQQLAVIQLHLDCVSAVLDGRRDLLAHETHNLLVDGLSVAAGLTSD
ncbi:MAG: response regulator [Rhodospirillaceae bacterium]|nr:response regulator [Rhodospirillaceae bacterium]